MSISFLGYYLSTDFTLFVTYFIFYLLDYYSFLPLYEQMKKKK